MKKLALSILFLPLALLAGTQYNDTNNANMFIGPLQGNAATATTATNDSSGNNIATFYQPASATLTNLSGGNGAGLTNLTVTTAMAFSGFLGAVNITTNGVGCTTGGESSYGNINAYYGVPFPAGTYTNFVYSYLSPAFPITTNLYISVMTNGVVAMTVTLTGPVSANVPTLATSGTSSFTTVSNSIFMIKLMATNGALVGHYSGWSLQRINN